MVLFFAGLNGHVTPWPPDPAVKVMLTDAKAFQQIAKSRLCSHLLLRSTGHRLGGKDSDELHVLMSIIELMDVLEQKDCGHGACRHPTTPSWDQV